MLLDSNSASVIYSIYIVWWKCKDSETHPHRVGMLTGAGGWRQAPVATRSPDLALRAITWASRQWTGSGQAPVDPTTAGAELAILGGGSAPA